jgi:SAM-dependent methyltransferase
VNPLDFRRTSAGRIPSTDTEELAAMCDAAVQHWHDRLELLGYPQAYEDLFDLLLSNGTLRSLQAGGGRVLDCGIGAGAFSLALAAKVTAPVLIEGVDISPSMLLRACLNLDRVGVEVRPHLRNVKDLPFEENAFEVVIGAHVLERLLDDPFAGLSEMARVLKPGGPLVIAGSGRSMREALRCPKRCYERIGPNRLIHHWMGEAGLAGVRAYPLLADGLQPRRVGMAWVGCKEGVGR